MVVCRQWSEQELGPVLPRLAVATRHHRRLPRCCARRRLGVVRRQPEHIVDQTFLRGTQVSDTTNATDDQPVEGALLFAFGVRPDRSVVMSSSMSSATPLPLAPCVQKSALALIASTALSTATAHAQMSRNE